MNLLIKHLIAFAIVMLAFVPTYLDANQQAYIPDKYKGIILNAPEPDFSREHGVETVAMEV